MWSFFISLKQFKKIVHLARSGGCILRVQYLACLSINMISNFFLLLYLFFIYNFVFLSSPIFNHLEGFFFFNILFVLFSINLTNILVPFNVQRLTMVMWANSVQLPVLDISRVSANNVSFGRKLQYKITKIRRNKMSLSCL